MKSLLIIFLLSFLAACGRNEGTDFIYEAPEQLVPTVNIDVDMDDVEDHYFYLLGVDGASYTKSATGTYELITGSSGGKVLLGFPSEVSADFPLLATSSVKFHVQRLQGNVSSISLNLIVDSACDGIFRPAADAVVKFTVPNNGYFTLKSTTVIAGIDGGHIAGVAPGQSFAALSGKCLINSQVSSTYLPDNKKLAGLIIQVGDGSTDVGYEISDVEIRL